MVPGGNKASDCDFKFGFRGKYGGGFFRGWGVWDAEETFPRVECRGTQINRNTHLLWVYFYSEITIRIRVRVVKSVRCEFDRLSG